MYWETGLATWLKAPRTGLGSLEAAAESGLGGGSRSLKSAERGASPFGGRKGVVWCTWRAVSTRPRAPALMQPDAADWGRDGAGVRAHAGVENSFWHRARGTSNSASRCRGSSSG